MSAFAFTSAAEVAIDRPERWAKQLVSHLGRRAPATEEGGTTTLQFELGRGTVTLAEGRLLLTAAAAGPGDLEAVERTLGGHLSRFAARERIVVAWSRQRSADAG